MMIMSEVAIFHIAVALVFSIPVIVMLTWVLERHRSERRRQMRLSMAFDRARTQRLQHVTPYRKPAEPKDA